MSTSKYIMAIFLIILVAVIANLYLGINKKLPIVAIANWGPHASLDASIEGIKDELQQQGYVDKKNIRIEIADVGFDPSLIPQMMTNLKSHHPKVMVVISTPVAEFAKGSIKNIPLIYSVVTDPLDAGLLKEKQKGDGNMTGSADRQDLSVLLEFIQKLNPHATRVGLLYATAESNDLSLVNMMKKAAKALQIEILAIPVDHARDVPIAVQKFKDKVDFIYVGGSGQIQPTLPVIVAEARKMRIPVINFNEDAVKHHRVLASFGVDYHQVGVNAGKLVAKILQGADISTLTPYYPGKKDHHGFISLKNAKMYGIAIPQGLENVEIVE